jgi:hypothetical protein
MATGSFSAIRTAFDNLNTLVLDQRQWEERQAQSEMDNEWRHTVLRSDLAQQKFNNEMTERSQVLAERGFADRHQAHTQNMKQANLNYDIAKETLAFDRKRRPLMLQDQKVKLENAQLDNHWETESTGLDVSYLDPEDYNDVTIGMINERLAGQGMSLTPDGKFMSADGTEVSMPRYMQGEVHKIVVASALLNDKTKEKVMNKVLGIQAEAQTISDEMSTIKPHEDGGLGRVRIASLKRQLATKIAEAKKEAEFFTPKNQIDTLLQQANMMEKAATEMSTDKNNALYVESLFESAKRKRQEAQEIADIELEQQKVAAKAKSDGIDGTMTVQQMITGFERDYQVKNAAGEMVVADGNTELVSMMKNIGAEFDIRTGSDPRLRGVIQRRINETTKQAYAAYWKGADRLEELMKKPKERENLRVLYTDYVKEGKIKNPEKTKDGKIVVPGYRAAYNKMKKAEWELLQDKMRVYAKMPKLQVAKPNALIRKFMKIGEVDVGAQQLLPIN